MSQHHCDTQRLTRRVRVILGYDRMLSQFFMDIVPLDAEGFAQTDRVIYSTGADPCSRRADIDFFREKLDALRIRIPEAMFRAVLKDRDEQVGNYVVQWRMDGSSTVLIPKEGSTGTGTTDQARYGIWCMRLGGQFGPAEAWLKEDGNVVSFESHVEASQAAAQIQSDMKSPNLRYEARELSAHLR